MDDRNRGSLHRYLWGACILVALLLPGSPLFADEGEEGLSTLEHEPITLRGQRIPSYEVFETFLLHASFIYEMRGPDAYRDFLTGYGLNPDLKALRALPRAFEELETSRKSQSDLEQATRLGGLFANVLAEIANDPNGIDGTTFRFELVQQLRPSMSWVFLDVHPNFAIIDQSEEKFRDALSPSAISPLEGSGEPHSEAAEHETESPSGVRIKISHLGDTSDLHKTGQVTSHARFEWRRYARKDGSVRVVGLIDRGTDPLFLVDMSFPTDEHLRPEFKHGGIDGVLRFAEDVQVDLEAQEKSHTTLGCFAAQAAAGLACALCASPPDPITCSACVIALGAAAAACGQPHCDQIQCNHNCVQACHLYGLCSSTGGSSSPADCNCVGRRYDIPGCHLPCSTVSDPFSKLGFDGEPDPIFCNPCSTTVTEVEMLRLDGSGPVKLSTGAVTLNRLEQSDVMHMGDQVSYLMGEWAVVDFGAPGTATKSAGSVRTLRSSWPDFGASQAQMLSAGLPGAAGGSAGLAGRLALVVAVPPHEANSREIPMPSLTISSDGLPAGVGRGQVAIRADFSEAGVLQGFEVLADTMGGISPRLAEHIEQSLSLQRQSEKDHRVVAFAVLSVGDSLRLETSLPYLPKCCCGGQFCQ